MNSELVCINDVLPNEILVTIFEYIPYGLNGLMSIAGVCHLWRKLVQTTKSLQNELKLLIRSQSKIDQLKLIPHNLRLRPRDLFLVLLNDDDYVSLKDPIWKQMSFGSIILYLDSRVDLEDVIYFFQRISTKFE